MTQELIYTSVPRGLAPDSSGFCTVACTLGMHPLTERALVELSGYRHTFLPGDDNAALNPVSLLHAIRRVSGNDLHVLSRISDCDVDYTGRSNLIAHHIALGQNALPAGGPAAVFLQPRVFETSWHGEPHDLPPKMLPNISVAPQKCIAWERVTGDASWGGVVAEAAEEGHPISLIFKPGMELLPLINEALALLPPEKRWRVTFSTFFMKSQEPPGANKIQIKCILAGSPEMKTYARLLTSQTLYLDLREPLGTPTEKYNKYIETARTGIVAKSVPLPQQKEEVKQMPGRVSVPGAAGAVYDFKLRQTGIPQLEGLVITQDKGHATASKKDRLSLWVWLVPLLIVLALGGGTAALFLVDMNKTTRNEIIQRKIEEAAEAARAEEARIAVEEEAKAAEEARVAEEARIAEKARIAAEEEAVRVAEEAVRVAEAARVVEEERIAKAEAEEKAEAKRVRIAHEKAQAEKVKREIAALLNNLPPVWKGLPLERDRDYSGLDSLSDTLSDSKNLWKWKGRIKLEIVPFVDLGKGPKPIKIKSPSPDRIEVMTGDSLIAFIEINEDQGVVFTWKLGVDKNNRAFYNRLLLSSLRVRVDGQTKDIALFEPIIITPQQSRQPLLQAHQAGHFLLPPAVVRPATPKKGETDADLAESVIDPVVDPIVNHYLYQFAFGVSELPQLALENPIFAANDKWEFETESVYEELTGKRVSNLFKLTIQAKGDLPRLPISGRLVLVQDKNNISVALNGFETLLSKSETQRLQLTFSLILKKPSSDKSILLLEVKSATDTSKGLGTRDTDVTQEIK